MSPSRPHAPSHLAYATTPAELIPVPAPGTPIDRTELLDAALALGLPLGDMETCMQAPDFHAEGDVLTHTLGVLEVMVADPAYAACPEPVRAELYLTALLHDVAKPACTRVIDGRPTHPGHAHRGEKMARVLLWRAGLSPDVRERIAQTIRFHLHPFFLLERPRPVPLATEIAESVSPAHLAILARADIRGRICADAGRLLEAVDLFEEFCAEQGVADGPYPFPSGLARLTYFASQRRDHPRIDRDYDPYRPSDTPTMVVTSGLPATGKDTAVAKTSLPVVSLDQLREELGLAPTGPQGEVVAAAREAARVHLRRHESFIWNATGLTRQLRGAVIDLGVDYGASVECWAFEAPEALLRSRNAQRTRPVPDPALARMIARWEPPTTAECAELTVIDTSV